MGLSGPPLVTADQQRRSYLTVIRRNWHLLPYEQLLELLGWTPKRMAFTLREDHFLFIKLCNLKPDCPRLDFVPPSTAGLAHETRIAARVREAFPSGLGEVEDPLFGFIDRLSERPPGEAARPENPAFKPGFCYSYFALYGDPLLETDPYPEGYLERLARLGV